MHILEEHEDGSPAFSQVEDFKNFEEWKSEGQTGYGPLFVVDECHKALADTVGIGGKAHPLTLWFAEHRHGGTDVVLMTQDRNDVPGAIRGRVEYVHEFRKLSMLGMSSKYTRLTYQGTRKDVMATKTASYERAWMQLYRSRRRGVEEAGNRTENILLTWRIWLPLGLAAAFLIWVMSGDGLDLPGTEAKEAAQNEPLSTNGPGSASAPTPGSRALLPGGEAGEITSPEIEALRREIRHLQLERQRDYELTKKPKSKLHGRWVQISGHMVVNAQSVYWLQVVAPDGHKTVLRGDDLFSWGYELMSVNACMAWLKAEGFQARISCETPTEIEHQDLKPVAASERRLALDP